MRIPEKKVVAMSGDDGLTKRPYAGGYGSGDTSFDIVNSFLDVAPVDLGSMAERLGISVNMNAPFDDGASGRIKRSNNARSGYEIEVNMRHSSRRKRFTLAHEIAHYLLHRSMIGDGITDDALYRSGLGSRIETEANKLAAELLMPARLVRPFWRGGMRGLAQLCNLFDVSEAALRIRLEQLRLNA